MTQGQINGKQNTRETLELFGADIFTINNMHHFCIVDYHSEFPIMKQVEGFSTGNLIKTCKIVFSEYGPLSNIVSDAVTNLLEKSLRTSAKSLAFDLQYHHYTTTRAMGSKSMH